MFKSHAQLAVSRLHEDFARAAEEPRAPVRIFDDSGLEDVRLMDFAPLAALMQKVRDAVAEQDFAAALVAAHEVLGTLRENVGWMAAKLPRVPIQDARDELKDEVRRLDEYAGRALYVRHLLKQDEENYQMFLAAADAQGFAAAAQMLDTREPKPSHLRELLVAAGRLLVRQERAMEGMQGEIEALKARLAEYETPHLILDKKQIYALKPPGGNGHSP